MTTRRTGWIVGGLAVALVLSTLAPAVGGAVLVLAVPITLAGSILTRRRPTGHQDQDGAERLVAAATTLGAAAALLGRPHRLRSLVVAATVAVAFGAGLLGVSRAGLGDDGLGSVTMLVPPVLLFTIGYGCARSTRSLRFGLETAILDAANPIILLVHLLFWSPWPALGAVAGDRTRRARC